ncbi:inositol monophosphatase [Candidatus Micrarchaeota archaeon]|nr:inositol monophosphatase [Candidatus Micrarchaeota archaeon]
MTRRAFLEKTAKKAGKLLMEHFGGNVHAREKAVKDWITDADLAAEELILKEIRDSRFDAPVLSEEHGGHWKDEDTFWIIDPLDGTMNFAIQNPLFGLNIAYVQNGKPQAAVTFLPYLRELFYAEKGRGAWLNGKKISCPRKPLKQSIVFATFSYASQKSIEDGLFYEERLAKKALRVRNPGALSMGLSYVACGRYGGVVHHAATAWDITAGALLIQEAGGKVTDFRGKPFDPFMPTLCAGNAQNHAELLKAIQ